MKREIIKSIYWFLPALLVMMFSGALGINAQAPTSKLKGEISTSIPGGDTVNLSGAKTVLTSASRTSPSVTLFAD